MRSFPPVFILLTVVGCTTSKVVTITTMPPDATIKVDGQYRGMGKHTETFVFNKPEDIHMVTVSRLGYEEKPVSVTRAFDKDHIQVELEPLTRRVNFVISPLPAHLYIDGKRVTTEPTTTVSTELEFTVDAGNNWINHEVVAERPGFKPDKVTVAWMDQDPNYALNLGHLQKDLAITSNPAGAEVYIDGERVGATPLSLQEWAFPPDINSGEIIPQQLRVVKPGYPDVQQELAWDDGRTEYQIDLTAKTKDVRITTNPPGAAVTIAGKELERDNSGASVATLAFPPVDDTGKLRTYDATVAKKTAETEWHPQQLAIAWDEGRSEYNVTLNEVRTRKVPLVSPHFTLTDEGWQIGPKFSETLAMKDVGEGAKRAKPQQITKLPPGTIIDTLAVSPDGEKVVFTILLGRDSNTFRSQMMVVDAAGAGGADFLTNGKTLDLTPSYTAGGDQIVFSSNRAGKRLSVWSMSTTGAGGITQLSTGDSSDLWPSIDSDPRPRLYYEARVDTREDPRLYMTQLGTLTRTDLTQISGMQPRVSPKADAVLFTAVNDETGKRDIYRMSDRGGVPQNLTNTRDVDEFDPAWSRDGSRIVYASDSALDEEKRRNYDIWVMDLAQPNRPIQITVNGSHDDRPAFEPRSGAIIFRSNRGGQWAIWRLDM